MFPNNNLEKLAGKNTRNYQANRAMPTPPPLPPSAPELNRTCKTGLTRGASIAFLCLAVTSGGCASMRGSAMNEAPLQAFPDGTCARASHVASLLPVPAASQEKETYSLPLPSVAPFSRTAVDTASVIGVLPELMVIASARDGSQTFERLLTARPESGGAGNPYHARGGQRDVQNRLRK